MLETSVGMLETSGKGLEDGGVGEEGYEGERRGEKCTGEGWMGMGMREEVS